MKFSYLNTFVSVINNKSISMAAKELYISQPAVTKQIKSLEQYYCTKLVYRDKKELKPTEAGINFYEYALNVINSNHELKANLSKNCLVVKGNFNIISSNIPAYNYLPNAISNFLKNYKNVNIKIEVLDSCEVLKKVKNGSDSFGFVGEKKDIDNISYIKIFEDEMVLVGNSNYDNININEEFLQNQKYLVREVGSATLNDMVIYLANFNVKLSSKNVLINCLDNELLKKMLINTSALSYVSKKSLSSELKEKKLTVLDTGNKRSFYYIYNPTRHMSPPEKVFHEFILKNAIS